MLLISIPASRCLAEMRLQIRLHTYRLAADDKSGRAPAPVRCDLEGSKSLFALGDPTGYSPPKWDLGARGGGRGVSL
jgi:hypothetical protein